MCYRPAWWGSGRPGTRSRADSGRSASRDRQRVLTDGGTADDDHDDDDSDSEAGTDSQPQSNVEITEAGEAEPADPKWDPPAVDDIPEFEVRADEPAVAEGGASGEAASPDGPPTGGDPGGHPDDPTAGRPHDAQAPGSTAISSGETEAYLAAIELTAKLPAEVRLPEEAADLVPAAVEAELEQDIQSFAASEFDNPQPYVDRLSFEAVGDEVWLVLRIGLPAEGLEDLDPDQIREYALQQLEGVL